MRLISIISTIIGTLSLSGCSKEEVKTVDWYKQNRAELAKKVVECGSKPLEKSKTQSCINAIEAVEQMASYRDLVVKSFAAVSEVKAAVMKYYSTRGKWPANNTAAGLSVPGQLAGEGYHSITVNNNTIEVVYKAPVASDENNTIIITATLGYGVVSWDCRGGSLYNEVRPQDCKIVMDSTF